MVERQGIPSASGLDRTFAALADPTRRAILARLRNGAATISEIATPFEMTFAGVSKHLQVLERAGLLARDVVGREHRISLIAAPLRDAADWALDYHDFWERRLDALEAFVRRRKPAAPARADAAKTPRRQARRRSRR